MNDQEQTSPQAGQGPAQEAAPTSCATQQAAAGQGPVAHRGDDGEGPALAAAILRGLTAGPWLLRDDRRDGHTRGQVRTNHRGRPDTGLLGERCGENRRSAHCRDRSVGGHVARQDAHEPGPMDGDRRGNPRRDVVSCPGQKIWFTERPGRHAVDRSFDPGGPAIQEAP